MVHKFRIFENPNLVNVCPELDILDENFVVLNWMRI
jgi:hypothetical protein